MDAELQTRPPNVGILNMEIYFPSKYVDQAELEQYDGVSSGKYTIGLGQTKMGFCDDREDVNSICLTVLERLIRKTPNVGFQDIGRLEVGTETLIDKSKSVKTVLMKLFEESGNSDVEGVDSINACYGGTAALFNSISWIESSYWDGRLAVVVSADIAVYSSGNARPTGGAGAVAMLIGPNAPLVFDRGLRATHAQHVYDFYKPDMSSEYPVVDGKLSVQCYLSSLDRCYQLYKKKACCKKRLPDERGDGQVNGGSGGLGGRFLATFDAVLFHSPYCKLVQKSFARLALNDFLDAPEEDRVSGQEGLKRFANVKLDETYFDRDVEKAFMAHTQEEFQQKTKPSLMIATNVGNMYAPSVYGGLISYLCAAAAAEAATAAACSSAPPVEALKGKKVGCFSYGSGSVSSFFSLTVKGDLSVVLKTISDVLPRLDARTKVDPAAFTETMNVREKTHHLAPYSPSGDASALPPGTWYLESIDDQHRRAYARVEPIAVNCCSSS